MGGQGYLDQTEEARTEIEETAGDGKGRSALTSVEVQQYLDTTEKGTFKTSLNNFALILRNDSFFHGKFRFNLLNGTIEISGFPWWMKGRSITDTDENYIRLQIDKVYGIDNRDKVHSAIDIVANQYPFDPIKEKLLSLKWDGQDRISELFPMFLGSERSEYITAVTRMILYGAIQRILHPGCKFDNVVVLIGTNQGEGKSTICRFLALDDEWFTDSIKGVDGKEAFESLRGHWVVEFGEMLVTSKTKTIEQIKSFLSATKDTYRTPYDKLPIDWPRRCIFIGTTNKIDCLPNDSTGNRRFYPVLCDKNRAERHPLDDEAYTRHYIEQMYAQAMREGDRDGWPLTLDPTFNAELDKLREDSTPENPFDGIIQLYLDEKCSYDYVCTMMIRDCAFNEQDQKEKYILRDIANFMNHRVKGWRPYRGKNGTSKDIKFYFGKERSGTTALCIREYGYQRAWERIPENLSDNTPEGFKVIPDDENVFAEHISES